MGQTSDLCETDDMRHYTRYICKLRTTINQKKQKIDYNAFHC